ncbi:MAG: hypothetical protein DWQ04_05850 [Chloroflexi bacterium]|nr:MAG: hypothetical protein DWQ04_05850 [Chloroflexota bacterium]
MSLPNVLFQKALKAYRVGEFETARLLLIEFLQGNPQNEQAWFWFGRVTKNPEEKRAAFERAVHLKPDWAEARAALASVEQNQIRHTLGDWQIDLTDLYAEAKVAVKNGRYPEALRLLKQHVQANPDHVNGWLALSRLSANPELKIIALDKAIQLNPKNKEAKKRLKTLKSNHKQPLKLGIAFESVGELERALSAFRKAQRKAKSSAGIQLAKKRQQAVKQQIKQQKIQITTPTYTLVRFAAGPVTLYGLLLLIQAGLNPLRIPFVFYVGILFVVLGSLLLTLVYLTPNHRLNGKLMESAPVAEWAKTAVFSLVGLFCIVLPFLLLFMQSVNRLELFRASLF